MKVHLEISPEERESILEVFHDLINEHPVNSAQDLISTISTILMSILNSSKESIIRMSADLVKETLQESPVYQVLASQYDEKSIWEGNTPDTITEEIPEGELIQYNTGENTEEEQQFIDLWNNLVKKKEYIVIENKYKS